MVFAVIIILLLIVVSSFAGKYNSLVTANENINGKWSQVENNLKEERI